MKISRLSLLALIPALTLFFATSSSAQSPDGQFGIQAGTQGLGLQYALSPSIHLGTTVNLQLVDGDHVSLLPYAKFLLEGEVNPYFKAGVALGDVNTTIFAAFGLEYFINRNVGIFGEANLLQLDLDLKTTFLGMFGGDAGVEWFFN